MINPVKSFLTHGPHTAQTNVCAPTHSDKLELSFILLFVGREERGELFLASTVSSVTLKSSSFYGDFISCPERTEISLFSNDFRVFYFCFRLFFVIFP